ncbi:MAG: bifunctional isocitrate dehydrogenase kinase/phosphatase [Calditrichaeota bacterium]|nr:bifunctional isocitrate dehydrogenase kinase/phosphatase [Calditrichota bacterium]
MEAFDGFDADFKTITRRAKQRFEARDWQGGWRDAATRLDAYENAIDCIAERFIYVLGERARDEAIWALAKQCFADIIADRYDVERAETLFNSVTRKMLKTIGVNRNVEFFYLNPKINPILTTENVYHTYSSTLDTQSLVKNILLDFAFQTKYEDVERDAEYIAQEINLFLWPVLGLEQNYTIDVVKAVFFRNKEAYIVGRINAGHKIIPLIIPLTNCDKGICAETVLLETYEVGVLFSFAYSYFFVDVERYDALIQFLQTLNPQAERAELYNSLGYNRHGKTEYYRDLHRFIHINREKFIIAPGIEGAVMIVFTLPEYNFVLKIIKDRPCFLRSLNTTSKTTEMADVRRKYDFVSHRDRAGRMVDTQEFENLRFRRKRFSDELLIEFAQAALNNVQIDDDYVTVQHLYVQRRVIPLPMFFEFEKNPEVLRAVLIDFGYFIKDIAASGVFPADLFNTWNYGVTNWGRVVLFDYDDVLPIEKINFREKPVPRNEFEENEPEEDWICASEDDFFMDEIERYSGIPHPLKSVFKAVHGDLYTLQFWHSLTEKLSRGEMFDVIPYNRAKRFCHKNIKMS